MRRILIAAWICILAAVVASSWLYRRSTRFDFIIGQAAARHGVDFHLVKALIYEESWFRPGIRGAAGEVGLMQITRAAAADYTKRTGFPGYRPEQLLDPALNVEIGCWYLKDSLTRYRNSPHPELFALLRYNAGETPTRNWLRLTLESPPPAGAEPETHFLSLVDYPKTRTYAGRILKRWRQRRYWF